MRYGAATRDVIDRALTMIAADTNLAHVGVHAHYRAMQLTGAKHPGFQEENEWRAIIGIEKPSQTRPSFRAAPMAIIPYITIPVPTDAIVRVRVGPGQYTEARPQ